MRRMLLIGLVLLACAACEKELDRYEGASGIYFDTKEMYMDTVSVHWGLKNSEVREQSLRLKVCLFGNTRDYDRKFTVEVCTEPGDAYAAVEGEDYRSVTTDHVIPANEAETYIDVQLLRSDALAEHPRRFSIRLIPTEELAFLYSREIQEETEDEQTVTRPLDYQRVILMNEEFPIPEWWSWLGYSVFGDWSMTKCILICDVMDIDREIWVKNTVEGLSDGYLRFVGRYMQRWLNEYPQTDENGELMVMGPDSQG